MSKKTEDEEIKEDKTEIILDEQYKRAYEDVTTDLDETQKAIISDKLINLKNAVRDKVSGVIETSEKKDKEIKELNEKIEKLEHENDLIIKANTKLSLKINSESANIEKPVVNPFQPVKCDASAILNGFGGSL